MDFFFFVLFLCVEGWLVFLTCGMPKDSRMRGSGCPPLVWNLVMASVAGIHLEVI